ncbi:hypothetical protein AN403_3599 [Pseudomonas fluorescens]|uniref:Uncharacterized protein n=1 Tax=Pseudomonas fluorescens TaxID=294 RepID=A0A0P8ZMW4_PSEFL|nr:hypothetical protein AN403_3599 [Pseudomonas fluorescens]
MLAKALCLARFFCVHIRFCGHGFLWFRFYSGLLGRAPSNQGLLPLTFGASPRLGIPSLRSCSVGPPRSAIHGRTRLTRHPCRVAHCTEPPLGLSRGQEDQKPKPKPKRGGLLAGLIAIERRSPVGASLLAKNAGTPRGFRQPASSLTTIASKLAPTEEQSKGRSAYSHALHHPTGRALARLPLLILILIHPPPRQAEWRCSSGEWRAAPFDAVEPIACRSSEADRRAMPPDECRSEGTPSPSEGPDVRGERFFCLLFLRRLSKKVSRRQGETASRRYRKNGYVHSQQKTD